MASSEVDQKFLGHFAKTTGRSNAFLSSFLYRVLGLSVVLSEKLLRARKTRRFDPLRDPKSKQLVHHILWLAREGLVMVEQYVLPMVGNYVELKVLAHKLRASFYHIFVLFHNEPSISRKAAPATTNSYSLFPDPLSPRGTRTTPPRQRAHTHSGGSTPIGGPVGGSGNPPPGLPPPIPKPTANNSATFLLPLIDYTPTASSCFAKANELAERLLPGSHPVRLSVKVEYVAYLYDCLNEAEQSRRLAKQSIKEVYDAQEGMDDESFEDAAELVGILGKMMRRGLGGGSSGSGSGSGGGGLRQRRGSGERSRGNNNGNGSAVLPAPRATTATTATTRGGGGKGSGGRGSHRRGVSERTQAPNTWV